MAKAIFPAEGAAGTAGLLPGGCDGSCGLSEGGTLLCSDFWLYPITDWFKKKKLYFGINGRVLKQLLLGVEVPGLGTLWRSEHRWA